MIVQDSKYEVPHSSQGEELNSSQENIEERKQKSSNKNKLKSCLADNNNGKRETDVCNIRWYDVDQISNSTTRNYEEIVIDTKKFLEYSKKHIENDEKSKELIQLAEDKSKRDGKVVGAHKKLLYQVIEHKGYKNYIQQQRINDIAHHIIARDGLSPELKWKLINALGKIYLINSVYGTVVYSGDSENTINCVLTTGAFGYSFLSQSPPNMLEESWKQYTFKLAKDAFGALTALFYIIDIGISTNNLIKCHKRAATNHSCINKELRDNIETIALSSTLFTSGIVPRFMESDRPVGVVVGMEIIVGLGINNLKFPEISFLKDATIIKYNTSVNGLTFNASLVQNGQYKLYLEKYIQNDNSSNYISIDNSGNNIILRFDNVTQLVYRSVTSNLEDQTFINHYQNIKCTADKCSIFSIVSKPNNDLWQFGSIGTDIIQNDGNTVFISGGEGSDLYLITQTKKYLNLSISNHAIDLALDILSIQSMLTDIILTRDGDHLVLDLLLSNYITILDYFRAKENRHIALMDQNNDIFIPLEIEDEIKLIPFCHKHLSKNIFRFFSTTEDIAIDINQKDIVLYQQENDLLITEQTADNFDGLNIILRNYYSNNQQWLDVKFYSYNNGVISAIDLNHMETSYMSYQNIHDSVIKTYILDQLTNKLKYITTIEDNHTSYHNSTLENYPIKLSGEKLMVLLFKDMPLKRLIVEDFIENTFIYKDNLYKDHILAVHNWTHTEHQIFIFEFDNGLIPDRIYVSNTTISRIKLNNEIDKKIDGNTTMQVIKALKSYCMIYNAENIMLNELSYSFLEEELDYRKKVSMDKNDDVEEHNAAEILVYLAFKSYNELLLKYPGIEKKDLRKIDDSCFGILLREALINMIIDHVNKTPSLSGIKEFINDKQESMNYIAIQSILDFEHRNHHGKNTANVGAHHRERRDVSSSASRLESAPIRLIKDIWSKVTDYFSANSSEKVIPPTTETEYYIPRSSTNSQPYSGYVNNTAPQYSYEDRNNDYTYSPPPSSSESQDINCLPYVWDATNQAYSTDGMTCTFSHGQAQIFSNIHQGSHAIQGKGSIRGDNYSAKSCHPVYLNGHLSMHCQGAHTNIVYTPSTIPPNHMLERINGTLCLALVGRNYIPYIANIFSKVKVLLDLEEPHVATSPKLEIVEIDDKQKNEWQDSIKKIDVLIKKLEKLSSKLSKENIKFDHKVIKNNIRHYKLDLEEHMKEIETLSKKDSTEYKTITILNEELEWLPKDLEYDIDFLNDQRKKNQQAVGQQLNTRYSRDHLFHSMSASYVGDNMEYCSNINLNHVTEQNQTLLGNMTSTESVKMFNRSEYYQKIA